MLKMQEAIKKKEKMDTSDEMRNQKRIRAQLEALQQINEQNEAAAIAETGAAAEGSDAAPEEPPKPRDPEDKIKISFGGLKKTPAPAPIALGAPSDASTLDAADATSGDKKRKRDQESIAERSSLSASHTAPSALPDAKRQKLSAIEEIRLQQEAKKERENRKDYWLCEGIIVKILNKKVADGAFYKKKAVVLAVERHFLGTIKVLETGHKLKVDQNDLETVIPNKGGRVIIVNGAYRGDEAILVDVNIEQFKTSVRIDAGPYRGNVVEKPYEDISKMATAEERS